MTATYQLDFETFIADRTKAQRGPTCEDADMPRLNAQALRVYRTMRDLSPWTLNQIAAATGDPPASVSARIREIRKYLVSNGLGNVLREKVPNAPGLFRYSLRLNRSFGRA